MHLSQQMGNYLDFIKTVIEKFESHDNESII